MINRHRNEIEVSLYKSTRRGRRKTRLNNLHSFGWNTFSVFTCLCLSCLLQTLPVQARLRFISPVVGGGPGLPPHIWHGLLPSAAAPPPQQRDQTTVYLQQAPPLLQLEVHGPVRLAAHAHAGSAAHIRHRWVSRHSPTGLGGWMCLKRKHGHAQLPERARNWKAGQKTVLLIQGRININPTKKKNPQTDCVCVCLLICIKCCSSRGSKNKKKVGEEESGRIDGVQSRSASWTALYSLGKKMKQTAARPTCDPLWDTLNCRWAVLHQSGNYSVMNTQTCTKSKLISTHAHFKEHTTLITFVFADLLNYITLISAGAYLLCSSSSLMFKQFLLNIWYFL